ncbi:hypothetical protein VTK26DRAFT_750 [Humicola hyalothermophila]
MAWQPSEATWGYPYRPTASDFSDTTSDDSRVCRVEGCRKKHAYISVGGQRIYSKFCINHTCNKPFPVEEGCHCPTPKRKEDLYCDDHLKCGEPGCDKRGEYRGLSEYVPWFCSNHRCAAPGCRDRAQDRQQQRCKAHFTVCSFPGCTRPCHLHRDGLLDVVCVVHYGTHKCAFPGCTRRKPGYDMKYCLAHKCAIPDCPAGRDPTTTNNSSSSSAGAAAVCPAHRCAAPYCRNPVAFPSSSTSLTCVEHTCRSRSSRCTQRCADPTTDFCRDHMCLVAPCRNEARFPTGYCSERHACVVPTCSKPRMSVTGLGRSGSLSPSAALDRDRCVDHAHARHRRAASMDYASPEVDIEALRDRFKFEAERKRLSDDIELLRRREGERERERQREKELLRLRGELEEVERWLEREGRGGYI